MTTTTGILGPESVGDERFEQSWPGQILQVRADDRHHPQNQQHTVNADVRVLKDCRLQHLVQDDAQECQSKGAVDALNALAFAP